MPTHRYLLSIGGELVDAADGAVFTSHEPATRRPLAELSRGGAVDAGRAVGAARRAFDAGPWPRMSGADRAAVLTAVAGRLAAEADRLAELEARDGGTTIRKATDIDLPGAVAAFEWAAWWARELPAEQPGPAGSRLRRDPLGVVACVVPWNFPLLLAAWRIAPAIAAGNTLVVKPASLTSVTACELVRVLYEAGLPAGVVNLLLGTGAAAGDAVVRDPRVDFTTFTGSDEVGAAVRAAGSGRPMRLDLGGKSAQIVLPDADLDRAAESVAWGVFLHGGQICMAGSRALVHRSRHDEFVDRVVARARDLVLGDPLDPGTHLGPLVARQQVRTVAQRVARGLAEGASLCCGGSRPEPDELPADLDAKAYYRPSVLADPDGTTTVSRAEIFGPVLAVTAFDSDEQAVALANSVRHDLAGSVWSADPDRATAVADGLEARRVWVNDYGMVDVTRPDPGRRADDWDRAVNDLDAYRDLRTVRTAPAGHRNPLLDVLR